MWCFEKGPNIIQLNDQCIHFWAFFLLGTATILFRVPLCDKPYRELLNSVDFD